MGDRTEDYMRVVKKLEASRARVADLEAREARLVAALEGVENAIDDWRQRLSEQDMRNLCEDERAILVTTHDAIRAELDAVKEPE